MVAKRNLLLGHVLENILKTDHPIRDLYRNAEPNLKVGDILVVPNLGCSREFIVLAARPASPYHAKLRSKLEWALSDAPAYPSLLELIAMPFTFVAGILSEIALWAINPIWNRHEVVTMESIGGYETVSATAKRTDKFLEITYPAGSGAPFKCRGHRYQGDGIIRGVKSQYGRKVRITVIGNYFDYIETK